jgi:hypothetical protein
MAIAGFHVSQDESSGGRGYLPRDCMGDERGGIRSGETGIFVSNGAAGSTGVLSGTTA